MFASSLLTYDFRSSFDDVIEFCCCLVIIALVKVRVKELVVYF